MKKYTLLALVASFVLSAFAHADVMVDRQYDRGQVVSEFAFQTNEDLGRAWIMISYRFDNCHPGEDCPSPEFSRVHVAGLSFDKAHRAVIFTEANSAPVVCARMVKHWYGMTLDNTGLCGVTRTAKPVQTLDDGFDTTDAKVFEVYFGKLPNGRRGD